MPLVGTKANAGAFGLGWSASSAEVLGGMVLMTPTSIASTGTGNSSSIGTNGSVTFSSCATLSLNGVFTSDYDNYMVAIRVKIPGATGDDLTWRLRASGTDNTTASSYTSQYLYADSTTVIGNRSATTYGYFTYSYAGTEMGLSAYFYGPNLSQPTAARSVTSSDKSSALIYDYAATHNQSVSYDGFTFGSLSVGRAMTGLVSVYGLGG